MTSDIETTPLEKDVGELVIRIKPGTVVVEQKYSDQAYGSSVGGTLDQAWDDAIKHFGIDVVAKPRHRMEFQVTATGAPAYETSNDRRWGVFKCADCGLKILIIDIHVMYICKEHSARFLINQSCTAERESVY
jgi:hypothetical protein